MPCRASVKYPVWTYPPGLRRQGKRPGRYCLAKVSARMAGSASAASGHGKIGAFIQSVRIASRTAGGAAGGFVSVQGFQVCPGGVVSDFAPKNTPAARGDRFLIRRRHERRCKVFHVSLVSHFSYCRPPAAIGSSSDGATGGGYALNKTRRYAHAIEYVRSLLSQTGWSEISATEGVLRTEGGKDVPGWVVVLRRS